MESTTQKPTISGHCALVSLLKTDKRFTLVEIDSLLGVCTLARHSASDFTHEILRYPQETTSRRAWIRPGANFSMTEAHEASGRCRADLAWQMCGAPEHVPHLEQPAEVPMALPRTRLIGEPPSAASCLPTRTLDRAGWQARETSTAGPQIVETSRNDPAYRSQPGLHVLTPVLLPGGLLSSEAFRHRCPRGCHPHPLWPVGGSHESSHCCVMAVFVCMIARP